MGEDTASEKILNEQAILDLVVNDEGLAQITLKTFSDTAPENLKSLDQHLSNGEIEDAGKQAHALKGALGYVAAYDGQELAKIIENACKDSNEALALETFATFIDYMNDLFEEIKEHRWVKEDL